MVQVFGGVTRTEQDVEVPVSAAATAGTSPPSDDPIEPGPGEIHIELDYFSIISYRGELVFPDGTIIDSDSFEAGSVSGIRLGRIARSEGNFEARGFTLPLELAEGMIYRVERPRAGAGTQISRQPGMAVRVFGPDSLLATFEPPGSRTGRWTVLRVVDGELVQILEEPEE